MPNHSRVGNSGGGRRYWHRCIVLGADFGGKFLKHCVFVTGTDTGIGKTYVTAALLAELRRRGVHTAAFKPVACGAGGRHDAEIYAALMNHEQALDVINPVYLRYPLAPSVAAKLEGSRIGMADPLPISYLVLNLEKCTISEEAAELAKTRQLLYTVS